MAEAITTRFYSGSKRQREESVDYQSSNESECEEQNNAVQAQLCSVEDLRKVEKSEQIARARDAQQRQLLLQLQKIRAEKSQSPFIGSPQSIASASTFVPTNPMPASQTLPMVSVPFSLALQIVQQQQLQQQLHLCNLAVTNSNLMHSQPEPKSTWHSQQRQKSKNIHQSESILNLDSQKAIPVDRALDQELAQGVVDLLESPVLNMHRGSVPEEKIRVSLSNSHSRAFESIITSRKSSWSEFISRHKDKFVAFNFEIAANKRLRLTSNVDWEAADALEKKEREAKNNQLLDSICTFLRETPLKRGTVDAFITSYPLLQNLNTAAGGTLPLPARGDLVRFIRKYNHKLKYDKESFEIVLIEEEEYTGNGGATNFTWSGL